jgi:hypothetical protein
MTRVARFAAVTAVFAATAGVWGSGLQAQTARTCFVVVDSTGGQGRQIDAGGGRVRWFQGGGIWAHCRGQATFWYSDSVAWFQDQDRFDMIGRVNFRDSTAELTANRASYYLGQERLDAFGDTRLRNQITQSVLRGPTLTYHRRLPGLRDTTLLTATQRPTVEYRSVGDTVGAEPYLIVADRVEMRGNTAARGWGTVTIDRSDFHGRSDSALLDTGVELGRLMSRASVNGGITSGYQLVGRDIRFRLDRRKLVWVQAEGEADATSLEWHLVADTVQFDLRDDRIQGGNAWGDSLRPEATSLSTVMVADSLAILAPEQVLEEVRGVGQALARSRRDSTDAEPDWVAGDTVTARFGPTATGGRALSQILSLGNARALYRVYAEGRAADTPDLSYSRGDRILAQFAAERLLRVDVAGEADGVYLEAPRRIP